MEKLIEVYKTPRYNKYSHEHGFTLTCDDPRFPISVFASDEKDAAEYCDHFLGANTWKFI